MENWFNDLETIVDNGFSVKGIFIGNNLFICDCGWYF